MIGKIEQTKPSQSGKTLSVLISGTWYTTKNWELQNEIGRNVIFEPSSSEWQGQTMYWLNDYVFDDQSTGPAAQAMDRAMAASSGQAAQSAGLTQAAQTTLKDRDGSIVAQALTKACTVPGDAVQLVWTRYTEFYTRYQAWNPADFSDDIPF